MRFALLAALIVMLSGCASSTPTIEADRLDAVQKGKTTYADIVRRFGRPSFDSPNLDGTRTTAYLHPGSRSDTSAMISLLASIASGTQANVNAVVFRFDAKDVLSSYTTSVEATAESGPAEAGKPAPAPVTVTPIPPGTAGASAPKPAGTAAASGTTTAAPAASAPAKAAPKKQPPRSDGLPSWLPSGNYDPRNPF